MAELATERREPASSPSVSPQFSIVWLGKDRLQSARRNIVNAAAQSCQDFEFVAIDCGSTDGTLDALLAAATNDHRFKVASQSALSAGEALLDALRRCRGDYIAICPHDGQFLPDALAFAAGIFAESPDTGGVCTSDFLIDRHGASLASIDIVSLLFSTYRPFSPAGFFRRDALLALGIDRAGWLTGAVELELWCRLATDVGIRSVSRKVVDSPHPEREANGLSQHPQDSIRDRLQLVSRMFSRDGFFGDGNPALALESKANQLAILRGGFAVRPANEHEDLVRPHLRALAHDFNALLRRDHRTLRSLHRLFGVRGHNLGFLSAPLQAILTRASPLGGRLPIHIGYSVWAPRHWGRLLMHSTLLGAVPDSDFHKSSPGRAAMFADLYAMTALLYDARGQIEIALEMWQRARPPDNVSADSLASQAVLKAPSATEDTINAFQRAWVARYIPNASRSPPVLTRRGNRKVRIGYHCSFMASDTIRYIMRKVMAAHDRNRFDVYGYSPQPVPDDIRGSFDVVRDGPALSEKAFTDLVRQDEIDVFVELSGFSPGHRFIALSGRCAPVQINYMNHTSSSQVPNIDYILADEISIPSYSGAQGFYSEEIYRIPGCFLSYDYEGTACPPVAPPPFLTNKRITFGCFGSGGKINLFTIEQWAAILHRVPDSILRLQNAQLGLAANRRFMADRFQRFGIADNRLVLAGGVDRQQLLRMYDHVDISLDTWPYCGGNTIAESLWQGVPVVSHRGGRFTSSYGASLVAAAGCADLAGETPEQYADIAVRLAGDPDRLQHLRQNLRRLYVENGLGDSRRLAGRLEAAYLDMLERRAPGGR